jgi:dolichol kinase
MAEYERLLNIIKKLKEENRQLAIGGIVFFLSTIILIYSIVLCNK